jgi:hypothetical protein
MKLFEGLRISHENQLILLSLDHRIYVLLSWIICVCFPMESPQQEGGLFLHTMVTFPHVLFIEI